MTFSMIRRDRIYRLIALCVKNGVTPSKTSFADFILTTASALFTVSHKTSRGYIDTLIQIWNYDKWKTFVKNNDYLTKEEKEKWMSTH